MTKGLDFVERGIELYQQKFKEQQLALATKKSSNAQLTTCPGTMSLVVAVTYKRRDQSGNTSQSSTSSIGVVSFNFLRSEIPDKPVLLIDENIDGWLRSVGDLK